MAQITYFYNLLNLVIDIGNTRIKSALYSGSELVELKIYSSPTELLNSPQIQKCSQIIIGSVVKEADELVKNLQNLKPTIIFTTQTPIPLQNNYKSLSTLGSDRLAASIGAYYLYPNHNVLVIDAGTCIKYNFTDCDNNYLGGAISPGLQMRFKALNHFTSKLPVVELNPQYSDLIGNNTQNSILSGVFLGTITEIDGIIEQYNQKYSNLICILTGGDADYLANRLKNSIFTHQNLTLKGLNDILNYTIESKKK